MFITILTVVLGFVFVVLCLFLILIVLLQPGKSGGLGGLGGGSASAAISETLGATQAEKSLGRWTTWGMAAFFVMCLLLTFLVNYQRAGSTLSLPTASQPAAIPVNAGAAPTAGDGAVAPEGEAAPAPAGDAAPAAPANQ